MTYSDCWIDTVDDAAFKALVEGQRGEEARRAQRIELLPSAPGQGHLWPPIVKEWAAEQSLPIHYVDPLCVQVPVSRAQLQRFLDDIFGPDPNAPPQKLRAHLRDHLRDDRTHLIVADEF